MAGSEQNPVVVIKKKSRAKTRTCYYCDRKTAWTRSLNGSEIPVCYDCIRLYDREPDAKKKKQAVVIPS